MVRVGLQLGGLGGRAQQLYALTLPCGDDLTAELAERREAAGRDHCLGRVVVLEEGVGGTLGEIAFSVG